MSEGLAGGPTAGRLLRQAREAAGLHVAALAVSLKVPVRKLEALEDDRYEALPDTVFARALASSVCRTLKVDPQPILDRLPQGHAPRLVPERAAINAPFRAPGDHVGPGWFDQLTRPVFLVVFALLLGAIVLIFMPTPVRDEAAAKPAEAPGVPMAAPTLTPGAEAPAGMTTEASLPSQAPSPAAAMTSATPGAGAATAAPLAVSSGEQPGAPVPANGNSPSASGLVVFKASGPSWVQVTDAKGTVTLRRLMAAGETAGASGNLPLAVTVGSASATSVQVRGKPYDLSPMVKDNVARFEVK
jgi:cytoskeleton protein RodZ